MTVKEFIETYRKSNKITFIKARARKDAATPFYHAEYQTTPIFNLYDKIGTLSDYIILNDAQPPIDWLSGAPWINQFKTGYLESLLIISPEDFELLYGGEEQRKHMIDFIDKKIQERRSEK